MARDCDWCDRAINLMDFVTFDNGVEDLEFCGNECLENYQERENDRQAERDHERSCQ